MRSHELNSINVLKIAYDMYGVCIMPIMYLVQLQMWRNSVKQLMHVTHGGAG